MALIEVRRTDGDSVSINTGYIFKVCPYNKIDDKKDLHPNWCYIIYDTDLEVFDTIDESYDSLIERIIKIEEGPLEE